jgi:thymidylate synthase (FAD)
MIELVGHYGSDETHALSAWTSTGRELTEERKERIDKLLGFLAREGHHTPFEKSTLHFLVDADTASHIHFLKHRIGVSVNGESARYKQIKTRHHLPDDWPEDMRHTLELFASQAEARYGEAIQELEPLLGRDRAKESARFFLTYANVLTLDVSFNFRSFMHFQGLRNKPDAQKEIRDIADEMLRLVRETGDFTHSLAGFGY